MSDYDDEDDDDIFARGRDREEASAELDIILQHRNILEKLLLLC